MDGLNSQPAARARVLAVDDEPENLDLLERCLRKRYRVLTARTGEEGLAILRGEAEVAAIISDYRMPGMNGAELLATSIDLHPKAKRIVITGYGEADNVIQAVNSGRIHYFLRKPWDSTELLQALDRLLNELDTLDFLEAHTRSSRGVGDIDSLTGLYNHRAFHEQLTRSLGRARAEDRPLALLYGDVDHFAALNGEIGYGPGDEILRLIGEIITSANADPEADASERRVVARYGGEEFAVLLPGADKDAGALLASRLRAQIADSAFPNGRSVTMSFGVSAFPDDATDAEPLVACAQGALRAAKRSGRNRVHLYRDDGSCARPGRDSAPAPAVELPATGASRLLGEKFPTYHERIDAVNTALERDRALSCLYIDLSSLRRIELEHGVAKHGEVTASVGDLLDSLRGERLRKDDMICRTDDSEAYLCFLSPARTRSAHPAVDLEAVATRVANRLQHGLGREIQLLTHERPHFVVGYARVLNNPMVHPEQLVHRLISEARQVAHVLRMQATQREKSLLQEIILHERLSPVYQPIIHLDSSEVFGFESLTRGPKKTSLESPAALFTVADDVDLTFELDRACFRGALRGAVGLQPVHRLFVNLLPLSFYDATFIEGEVGKLLDAASLAPANIVFEITERLAIENFASFRRALAAYTAMGFGMAIDDVGTRHSNLESVMALRPHFIKISDVLTRGVSRSTVKREMLRSLGRIAETIDAVVVAEGIETPDDLAVLCDLGVHYGQGFFLARPGPAFPTLRPAVRRAVRALARPRTPIPAPPADFDDDGDVHESFDNEVRLAVLERARSSGEIEVDAEILRALAAGDEATAAADAGSVPDAQDDELETTAPVSVSTTAPGAVAAAERVAAPAGTRADAPAKTTDEEVGAATRAAAATVEDSEAWKPLCHEDLGGIRGEVEQVSLLDSLRHSPQRPADTRDEETTSSGSVFQ